MERRGFIGGSDVAAILGLSPWKTAAGVWLEKTGRVDTSDIDSEFMAWGRRLEAPIIDVYAADSPLTVLADPGRYHCDDDWHRATPDAVLYDVADVFDTDGPVGGLEVKTTSQWNADQWDRGVPVHYQLQCQWYMHVCDVPWWDVAVLIGGNDYRTFRLDRDDAAIDRMVEAVDRFWHDHVEADVPPAVTGPDMTFRFVTAEPDQTADVGPEAVELAAAYRHAHAKAKEWQEAKEHAADELRQLLGPATEGTHQGRTVATWKPVTSRRFDEKRFAADHPHLHAQYQADRTYRRLHIPEENQ